MLLERITSPADVQALSAQDLPELCAEIRRAILTSSAAVGGHIGSNLGAVELIVAMHRVFTSPVDKFIFDVSHQTYTHKMLTGRAPYYLDPALFGTLSGFSNPAESEHDLFSMGHTSTSISLACGMAKARDAAGEHHDVVAVIGDGSLSGGLAFEGLDALAELNTGVIVVVNDNDWSIAENHGGVYRSLAQLRATNGQAPHNIFRALGLDYRFVREGNDVALLERELAALVGTDHPVVLHICTTKGAGYDPALREPEGWHHVGPFDMQTGELRPRHGSAQVKSPVQGSATTGGTSAATPLSTAVASTAAAPKACAAAPSATAVASTGSVDACASTQVAAPSSAQISAPSAPSAPDTPAAPDADAPTYADLTGTYLLERMAHDPSVIAISAATPYIMGFTPERRRQAGAQFVDVGIAEEHAVTFATGLARGGAKPVLGLYGVFMQRAYDELWHDLCLNAAPATILDFGASVFGNTDATHLSYFDLAMLGSLPHLTCLAPVCREEYLAMLDWALSQRERPVVIRVPGTRATSRPALAPAPGAAFCTPTWHTVRHGADIAVLALGSFFTLGEQVAGALSAHGINATLIDPRFATDLDEGTLAEVATHHAVVLTLEDGVLEGGWGEQVARRLGPAPVRVRCYGIPKGFPDRVDPAELLRRCGITVEAIVDDALAMLADVRRG